ncbi:hypothetical protein EV421DRAFT_1815410 [Armillaria borealis]|uniref:Uncharacterized protein n=1 Tax=Armillaria borealis TaxID=47425 RepID=A0AA39MMR2_9AGAR|nr:hypothetical protein EV421DRAFT_1815410 [Armillaria borealis]
MSKLKIFPGGDWRSIAGLSKQRNHSRITLVVNYLPVARGQTREFYFAPGENFAAVRHPIIYLAAMSTHRANRGLFQSSSAEAFQAIMDQVSKDQTEITTIACIVETLISSMTAFNSDLSYLITQSALAAPLRSTAIFAILIPIQGIILEFYRVIYAIWEGLCSFLWQVRKVLNGNLEHLANAGHHIRAARADCIRACEIVFRLDVLLKESGPRLVTELRGSRFVEALLRFTRRFCLLSSYRLDIMEGIPGRISMLCKGGNDILARFRRLGEVVIRIQKRFKDPRWRALHTYRQDVIDLLLRVLLYTSSLHITIQVRIEVLSYRSNSTRSAIEPECSGPSDPNRYMWDWYWLWNDDPY